MLLDVFDVLNFFRHVFWFCFVFFLDIVLELRGHHMPKLIVKNWEEGGDFRRPVEGKGFLRGT